MLRVPTQRLETGMILARAIPVPNEQGRILLQRGCQIPPDLARRLERYGINEVWVQCRPLEFLEEIVDVEIAERLRDVYWAVRRNFETTLTGAAPPIDPAKYDTAVTALYECLLRSKHGGVLSEKLDSYDNYMVSHSTNVCYMAVLLALKLERYLINERSVKGSRAKDVRELALGALLHDIGKTKLPQALLNKPSGLTPEEREIVKRHTTLGYELVKGRIPASSAQIVLNHHQRFDGTGYPERIDPQTENKMPPLSGKQIPIFSRIVSICDVYDAATTARCYSGAKPSVQAIYEMRQNFVGAFDPVVEAAFYEVAPAFPVGTCVTLSDGSEAVVVDFHPRHAVQPKVQRLKTPDGARVSRPDLDEIDLAFCDDLSIVGLNGLDVREYVACLSGNSSPLVGATV
jgi:HD-GYP domain-containing protein (c-di-GMP phosphodiesterase class II)